jgi:hypothetical protein
MDGYDKLADFMGTRQGMSIYRRFSFLGTKNILYLQAELVNLEAQLENIVLRDKNSEDKEKKRYMYSVYDLKRSMGGQSAQWLKMLEIRTVLKQYS